MDMEAMKGMMATSTPESRQQGMDAWKTWMTANAGIFADMGAPVGKNAQVSATGAMQMSNDIAARSQLASERTAQAARGTQEEVAGMITDLAGARLPGRT